MKMLGKEVKIKHIACQEYERKMTRQDLKKDFT